MNETWKPAGYNAASPYLIVAGARRLLEFLKQTFDAEELRIFSLPDGRLAHGEVRIHDTVIMLAEATPDWPAVPQHIHVYVPDVDATFQRAIDAGGVVVQPVTEREGDPDRRGGVKDPGGNSWWISTQVMS